ncbi:MAG: hypothetical protein E7570_07980 [Ruminococcaceae bacterium]|nr:hypothetical protein [Oscillospiraceae bacterium]
MKSVKIFWLFLVIGIAAVVSIVFIVSKNTSNNDNQVSVSETRNENDISTTKEETSADKSIGINKYTYNLGEVTVNLSVNVDNYLFEENGNHYFKIVDMYKDYGYIPEENSHVYARCRYEKEDTTIIVQSVRYFSMVKQNDIQKRAVNIEVWNGIEPGNATKLGDVGQNYAFGANFDADTSSTVFYELYVNSPKYDVMTYEMVVMLAYTLEHAKEDLTDFSYSKDFAVYEEVHNDYKEIELPSLS